MDHTNTAAAVGAGDEHRRRRASRAGEQKIIIGATRAMVPVTSSPCPALPLPDPIDTVIGYSKADYFQLFNTARRDE